MSNRGYALSRFSGDKVAYFTKCFLGLFTKSTSIFNYKWDEIAVIELLVRVLVSGILQSFFESIRVSWVFCSTCTVRGCTMLTSITPEMPPRLSDRSEVPTKQISARPLR